jgi:hypothetical protein
MGHVVVIGSDAMSACNAGREESVASARFLAAQFHESGSWSAAVRVGRQPTNSVEKLAANVNPAM